MLVAATSTASDSESRNQDLLLLNSLAVSWTPTIVH
jgi:hypothetical protein